MLTVVFLAALQAQPQYLVVDHLTIGYRQKGTWRESTSLKATKTGSTFRKVGLGTVSGAWRSTGIIFTEMESYYVEGSNVPDGVLFSGRPSVPRPVQALSKQNPVYVGELGKFLASKGIKTKPRIKQLLSVDLDGDGSKEILIEASNRDNLTDLGMHGARAGDYSLLLLRFAKGGRAINHVIQFDHPAAGQMGYLNQLRAVADFDGDGVMEVVWSNSYYEGSYSTLTRFKRGVVKNLVSGGEGA